jgi:amino acid permease
MKKVTSVFLLLVSIISVILGVLAIVNAAGMLATLGATGSDEIIAVYQRWGITVIPLGLLSFAFRNESDRSKVRLMLYAILFTYGGLAIATWLSINANIFSPGAAVALAVETIISVGAIIIIGASLRK